MNKKILIIFIIIVLVVAGGVYYFSYKMGYGVGFEAARIASQVTPGQAVQNPLGRMPETNPFREIVNPFKDLYKNPFK